jgi:hypothetical protein
MRKTPMLVFVISEQLLSVCKHNILLSHFFVLVILSFKNLGVRDNIEWFGGDPQKGMNHTFFRITNQ